MAFNIRYNMEHCCVEGNKGFVRSACHFHMTARFCSFALISSLRGLDHSLPITDSLNFIPLDLTATGVQHQCKCFSLNSRRY